MTAITSESVRLSVFLKFATQINSTQSLTFSISIFSEKWSISRSLGSVALESSPCKGLDVITSWISWGSDGSVERLFSGS